jgi:prephenate dehydrogenase
MKPIEECTVGIVGLGLMGGAIAMALRRCAKSGCDKNDNGCSGTAALLACDIDGAILAEAERSGVIDKGFSNAEAMLPQCDLVFLCLNPATLIRFMEQSMAFFKPGALITDIAGVKGIIVDTMEKELREDLDFIPGHPMAGAEKGGFVNAGLCNFQGKNYILTPLKRNKSENLLFLKELITRMGFSRITETTAAEHDRKIAFTSQLCHVIASALIDCEQDTAIARFGGGSFEDLTRIAMLNAPMWTELFIENRTELLARIGQFEESLDKLKRLIERGKEKTLEKNLRLIRERRMAMGGEVNPK